MRLVNLALFLALAGTALAQEPIIGHATVQDGDTLIVASRTVRMQGLDAPEIGQTCDDANGQPVRCGREATEALERLIGGRIVTCVIDPRDPADVYGRALGLCSAGGADLSQAMIAAGQAVAYRRYLDYREGDARAHKAAFIAAEIEARRARRGIWAGRFDLPDVWRRANRGRR